MLDGIRNKVFGICTENSPNSVRVRRALSCKLEELGSSFIFSFGDIVGDFENPTFIKEHHWDIILRNILNGLSIKTEYTDKIYLTQLERGDFMDYTERLLGYGVNLENLATGIIFGQVNVGGAYIDFNEGG